MKKIAMIAGSGQLPLYFFKESRKKNIEIHIIGLFDEIEEEIKREENFKRFNIGKVGEIVKYLLSNEITEVILMGKIEKSSILNEPKFDRFGQAILNMLPNKSDETLLYAVISFLKLNKIKVLPQNTFLGDFMVSECCYTEETPTKKEELTIKLGIKAAKTLSKLDIGQTVVCKDESIVALEGVEGTDETIKRAEKLTGPDNIVVKMSRPHQDMRVDIPVIGLDTIKILIATGCKGIVVESKKMMFIEKEEAIKLANENSIFIVGKII